MSNKSEEILKAASLCFARYGYEKTTLDDIGRQVRLNKASLYYYFKNKESIYTEVIYRETDDFLNSVVEKLSSVAGCREKLIVYFTERLQYIETALNFKQLSADSVQKIAPLFGEVYNRIIEKEAASLARILDECVKTGEIVPCETRRVARNILTITEAVTNKIDCQVETPEAYRKALEEITFMLSLLFDGLKRK